MRHLISIPIFMLLAQIAWAETTAYDAALSGKKCEETNQQINCTYKVGKDLEFSVDGIGTAWTGVTFLRSKGLEGDYYPSFGLRHGCVIIRHGKASKLFGRDFAFVSPKNGKVHQDSGRVQRR